MKSLPKVTFIVDRFEVGSPGQQLLDRFLIGYDRGGGFYSPGCEVELVAKEGDGDAIEKREKEFGLRKINALGEAPCILFFTEKPESHLRDLPAGIRAFVYGTLADNQAEAAAVLGRADSEGIALQAGTAVQGAFQLPGIEVPGRLRRMAAVSFGQFPEGVQAAESLFKLSKWNFPNPVVRLLTGEAVWRAAYSAEWNPLFAAAFSRSNTIQGDPVKDGRTQDVVGLRLVEKLVKEPKLWLIDDAASTSGLPPADRAERMGIFMMNGALEDLNVAFQARNGAVVSTQLYQPAKPTQDHFSVLAAQIEDFLRADTPPRPDASMLSLAGVAEAMRGALLADSRRRSSR